MGAIDVPSFLCFGNSEEKEKRRRKTICVHVVSLHYRSLTIHNRLVPTVTNIQRTDFETKAILIVLRRGAVYIFGTENLQHRIRDPHPITRRHLRTR